jgi:cysteine desulfurase
MFYAMQLRYFDHNATTPLAEPARDAWLDAAQVQWLNPSSPYRSAAAVRVRYEAARESLAARFGVEPERVVFTSGATEANNAVIRAWSMRLPRRARVGVNPTEHPSVIESAKTYLGDRVEWLPIDENGRVDIDSIRGRVAVGELAALSVMAANNETGVIQPWQALAELCAEAEIPYHCDASQWVGRMALDGLSACSYVTGCAHKFGGPKGVGFMLIPKVSDGFHVLTGGEQEMRHRAGTEDVAGVLAMVAALDASVTGDLAWRDAFIQQVQSEIPRTKLVGADAPRLWNTVSLIMPKYSNLRWIRALEKAGFLVSAGSACSTGKESVSSVLMAMGFESGAAGRALRISSGTGTSAEDWHALADALLAAYQSLEKESAASNASVISID